MRLVAFFRNLNLGQRLAPSRAQLEQAFLEGGATTAASFQTNGTVVFDAPSLRSGLKVVRLAGEQFHSRNGFAEPAFVRSWAHLVSLVERQPFATPSDPTFHAHAVTFLHAQADVDRELPLCNALNDVRVVAYTEGEMLCAAHRRGPLVGNPNVFAEKLFGLPATTRAWSTIERLLRST